MKENNLKLQYVISDFNENLAGGNDPLTPSFDVIENYYLEKNKFLENATGNKVMERVNIRTGKAYVSQFVYGVNGNRLPFNLSLTYNPYFYDKTEIFDDLTTNGKSGFLPAKGWKFNYQQYLRKQYNYYYYYDQNFELHKFLPALGDSSIYYDSTGQTGLTLKEVLTNDSITSYEITDGKNTTLTFNAQGALVNITEKRGANAINLTITYNQDVTRITSITDGANRTFNFVYDDTAKTITLTRPTSAEESTEQLAIIKLNNVNYLIETYYSKEQNRFCITYDYLGKIQSIDNYSEGQVTTPYYTTDKKISKLLNYKLIDNGAGGSQEQNRLEIAYDTNKTTVTNVVNQNAVDGGFVTISNTNHYYFANNGELIYTVAEDPTMTGSEQTLADRAKEFLDANTFATAKAFKEYGEALSSVPIIKFIFNNSANEYVTKINLQNNTPTLSATIGNVKISKSSEVLLMVKSTKTSDSTQTGAVTVSLKNNDANMNQDVTFSGDDLQIKFKKFTLSSGTYSLSVCATNQDSEAIDVEVWLCAHNGSNTKEVVNQNNGNPALIQQNTTWYETKKCNITNGTQTVENVEFTYRDYILTLISYFKNNSSFTAWYNDCKNAITGCTKNTLKYLFIANGEQTALLAFNMAQLQKTTQGYTLNYASLPNENATYIQLNTKTVFGDEERDSYARIDSYLREYYTKDANDFVTEYTYNSYGECTQQKVYPLSNSAMNILTTTGYNAKGEVISESSYKNLETYTTSYTYNEDGDIVTVTTPNGQVVNYDYNLNKLQKMHTTLSSSSTALENKYSYEDNNVSSLQSANGDKYGFDYNKFNEVINVKLNNTSILSQQTYYNNDKSGYVEITYGNGYVERRYFDKYGHINRICEVVNNEEQEKCLLFYSDYEIEGEDVRRLDDKRLVVSKNSLLRRILDKTLFSDYNYIYYDAVGNIIFTETYPVATDLVRDSFNRTSKITTTIIDNPWIVCERTLNYKNPIENEIQSEVLEIKKQEPDGTQEQSLHTITTAYESDALIRPLSTIVTDTNGFGYKQEVSYAPKKKQTLPENFAPSLGGGIIAPPLYETIDGTTNYIASVKTYAVNGETQTLEKTEVVDYDTNGNITKFGNNTYVYDGINRLTRENNADLNKSFTYAYDEHGNVTQKCEYAYTTGTLGTATSTNTYEYDSAYSSRLISVNNVVPVTYDNAGCPTSYRGKAFTWQGLNLKTATINDKEYLYKKDVKGRLANILKKNDKGEYKIFKEFYYSNAKLSYEYHEDTKTSYVYHYNAQGIIGFSKYISANETPTTYTFRKNIFGDITAIYQGATCVAKYKYDAWGNCTVCNPDGTVNTSETFIGNINPFRYRGYYWDKDLQLYYLQTRYYDPTICRFISPDSHEYLDPETFGGLNLYTYCYNNPISYADPSGNLPFFILTAIIGAIIGVGITALVDYIPDKEFDLHWGWYVGVGLLGAAIGAGIGMAISYSATGTFTADIRWISAFNKAAKGDYSKLVKLSTHNAKSDYVSLGRYYSKTSPKNYINIAKNNNFTYFDMGKYYDIASKKNIAYKINELFINEQYLMGKIFYKTSVDIASVYAWELEILKGLGAIVLPF